VPTIQLYHHQSQLRSTSSPRATPGVFGAQTAQALGEVSATIGQLGQKLADAADYRALTEYQLEEQQFQAKQEKWLLDNPFAEKDDILKRYRVERDAFNQSQLKKKHLSKRARERIGLMTQDATAKGDLATTQVARTREIKRAQNLSAIVKQQAIQAGDLEAFILRVDQDIAHGITAPELRDAEINHAKQQIQQISLTRQLQQTLDLPPAEAKARLNEIITSLQESSEETSALGLKQVNDGLSQAEHLQRKQDEAINKTAQNALSAIATGQADETLLHDLYEQGQIDKETLEFISGKPLEISQKHYAQLKATNNAKANEQEAKEYDTYKKLSEGILPKDKGGTVGIAEVNTALRFGRINQAQADRLTAEINNQALYERTTHQYKTILSQLLLPRESFLRTDELQNAADTIHQAALSKQAKVELQQVAFITQQEWLEKSPQTELNGAPGLFKDTSRKTTPLGLHSRTQILDAIRSAYALQANGTALTTLVGADAKIRELVDSGASAIDINLQTLNIIQDIELSNATATLDDFYTLDGDLESELGI